MTGRDYATTLALWATVTIPFVVAYHAPRLRRLFRARTDPHTRHGWVRTADLRERRPVPAGSTRLPSPRPGHPHAPRSAR